MCSVPTPPSWAEEQMGVERFTSTPLPCAGFLSVFCPGEGTQDFVHAKQTPYHCALCSVLFWLSDLETEVSLICSNRLWPCSIDQASPEFVILLPQAPESQDYGPVPPNPAVLVVLLIPVGGIRPWITCACVIIPPQPLATGLSG